jgi:alanine-synthesizing transaminase
MAPNCLWLEIDPFFPFCYESGMALTPPRLTQPAEHVGEILPAARLERVRYAIRDIAVLADEVARDGRPILPLNIGDPLKFDFRTPPHLIEAVTKAMVDGHDGYAPSAGINEAIQAIGAEAERKGIGSIQSAFVTQGVSEAVDVCLTALINAGEDVLTPSPEYPLYSAVLAKLGAEANSYALREESGWQPDLDDLARRITPRTRAVVVINPNNPTGAVYSRQTLEAIAELARQNRLVVFADEIYDKLLLDEVPHFSIASLAPDVPVVTFNGLSKVYLVPGWRVGWAVVSGRDQALRAYVEAIHKLLRSRLSANHPEQYAIRPALEGPQSHLQEVIRKLRSRRDLTMRFFREAPRLSCVRPQGAFYAFPRLEIEASDEDFVRELLVKKRVLVVHGSGFGQQAGTRHFRVVFLPDENTLSRAYQSIREFVRERYG